ncbi:hypothetical protein Tco_0324608 [Tanacetum coccineum]
MNVFIRVGFGSTIKLVSFDKGHVVIFNGRFVCYFRNSDCRTESQSDNTVDSPQGFIIHWIVILKNIKKVTEVIDVENWRIDNSRVLRWIVSLIVWNSSVSLTKSLIQSMLKFRYGESLEARGTLDYVNDHLKCLFLLWHYGFQSNIGMVDPDSLSRRNLLFITSNNLLCFS